MKSYITVIDKVLSPLFCEALIEKFERNEFHEQSTTDWENRHFVEVNISGTSAWIQEHEMFVSITQQMWKTYAEHHVIQMGSQWPKTFGYEQFRMKRYLPNGRDQFSFHTDVGSYASARRFLSFLWYLNDVAEGGMTKFAYSPTDTPFFEIKPVQGRVLMFPPLWTYPHWGEKVISGPKYCVSGYLHLL